MKHIELTHGKWEDLRAKLLAEYGKTILISFVCKRELGFTVREHRRFDDTHPRWEDRRSVICLDFYSETAKSWFILKYQ